jgi:SPP1 family predicted phage head-tail adaptor
VAYKIDELNQRVTFVRYSETQNEYGTLTKVKTTLGKSWALVRPMSGRERDRGNQTEARSNYLIVIRNIGFAKNLTEKDVAEWRGEELNIRFAKHRGRSEWLELESERGAPQ